MAIDVDLYRRSIKLPATEPDKKPITLSVIDTGPDEALRTIVFLHGFGGRAAYWLYQLEHFMEDNRVVALDLRGHGLSDAPHSRYTVDELVEDVRYALEILEVPQNFTLIAHSFGGAVSSYFMSKYPGRVEKLILIASAVQFKLRWAGRTLLKAPTPLLTGIRRFVPRARIYPAAHVVSNWNRNALSVWDGTEYLRKIDVPTLVILGQRDLLFTEESYRDVASLIPGAQMVTIPVSAHQVMVERPDAVNRAIERFIGPAPVTEERAVRRKERRELEEARPWLKFYDSRTPYKIKPPTAPIQRSLEMAARRYGGRPALVFYNRPLSYRALERQANRFANGLKHIGLQSGERVLIMLPNSPQMVIAYYGVLKAGGVVVFANPLAKAEEVLAQIQDSEAKIAVCLSQFYPLVKGIFEVARLRNIVVTSIKEYMNLQNQALFTLFRERQQGHQMPKLNPLRGPHYTFSGILRRGGSHIPEPVPDVNDLAVIQYGSHVTDRPTGVMLTHANLVANALQVRHTIPEARPGEEVLLGVLPFWHSYGLTSCLNFAPLVGATLVTLPNFETREVLETIARYHPTLFPGVPKMYLSIANFPGVRKYGVSSIRACISGGAPLAVEVQEAFEKLTKGRLVEGYGLTEAGPVTHGNPLSRRRRAGSIGLPVPDTEARIVDLRTGADLPPGETGELLVRGPQIMRGYWHRPEETERALTPDGWLHTGDVARMDEDGYFFLIDHKVDMVRAGEYNVYPHHIEEVLYEHPKVLDVAVIDVDPSPDAHRLKAFVVLHPGERAGAEELLEFCRRRLTIQEIPAAIEFLPELPRNFVGKILRTALAERER